MELLDRTKRPDILPLEHADIPKPERVVMPNGNRLAVLSGGAQDVFRLDILVHGGQWRQTMPLQANFTNRMLSEGTRTYTSAEISEMLDRYGAWMEQNTTVNMSLITLYSLNKYAEQTLNVVEKIVKEPVFPQEEFQVMVENARQKFLVNREKVDVRARKVFGRHLLGDGHPCAHFADVEDYARIRTGSLQDFFVRHYHSGNISVYLSGNVNNRIRKMVEERFGKRPWGLDSALVPLVPIPPVTSPVKSVFVECPDAVQSAVRMGCVTVQQNHPDFYKLQVLLTVLGGYFGSRLMRNVREDKGYTYGIGTGLAPYPYESLILVVTQCAHEYVAPLISEVYSEMEELRQHLIPDEELNMVKSYMLGELMRRYENVLSLSDAYITAETAGTDDCYIERNIDHIRLVQPDELRRMAGIYLNPDQIREVVAGKKV